MTIARTTAASFSAVQALLARTLADEADVDAVVSDLAAVATTVGGHTTTLASHTTSIAANASAIAALPTPQFTKAYESTEQTITAGGLLTLPHGMAVAPKLIELMLVCKTADAGYSVGDVVRAVTVGGVDQNASARGMGVVADATNVKIRFGTMATPICLLNASGSTSATITIASWKLLVRAYA